MSTGEIQVAVPTKDLTLRPFPFAWPMGVRLRSTRECVRQIGAAVEIVMMNVFLRTLLRCMSLAFHLLPEFRRNIRGFSGTYLFRTADGVLTAGARFANGHMCILHREEQSYNLAITFRNLAALRRFLLSRDPDVLGFILANEIAVDGNLNYIFKFGFMARDLVSRLHWR